MAQLAGYDGVEIIGAEGYLLSTFPVEKTNQRTDEYGGSFENRMRFALEIVEQTRVAVGAEFIIVFRVPAMDMLENELSECEVITFTKRLEQASVSIISTHFT